MLINEYYLFEDIGASLFRFSHFSCVFSPRNTNKVAHELARFALSIDDFVSWLEDEPSCLVPFFQTDLSLGLIY